MDRSTPNLPNRDLHATEAFYGRLGFRPTFKDDGWVILERSTIVLEFFPATVNPRITTGSAWVSVDDLDVLYAGFSVVGQLQAFCRTTPGVLRSRSGMGSGCWC